MAINVQYAPTASSMGGVAYLGGYGDYANKERRYQDQIAMRTQELLQRERMQAMQLQASAANQARQNQTALQQQLLGQLGRERLAVFGHQSGMQDRALQFEMQSRLGRDQTLQRDWLDEQQMNRRAEAEARVQAERADHTRREAEARAQQINQDAQRRIEAARKQMVAGQIRPGDFQAFEQRMLDEASQQLAGVEWETQMPQGPTPKEELEQTWHDQHVVVDGQPLVMSPDGKWYVPTNYKLPDDSAPGSSGRKGGSSSSGGGIPDEDKEKAKAMNAAAADFEKAVQKRAEEIYTRRLEEFEDPFSDSLPDNMRQEGLRVLRAQEAQNARREAMEFEMNVRGLQVPPQRYRPPSNEDEPSASSSGVPSEGTTEVSAVEPDVRSQSSFPLNPEPRAPGDEEAFAQRDAANILRNIVATETLEDGRKPVRSLDDLRLPDGTIGRPPDLTGAELAQLGSDVVGGQIAEDLGKPDVMSTLPPASQELIRELDQVANSEIEIGTSARPVGMGGFHGDVSWRNDPSTDNAAKSALRSVNVMRGIVAVYGADPSQWPEKVVRDTWQQVSDVARLKQAHAKKQANAPNTPEYEGEKATMANLGLPQHAQRTEKVGTQREVATVDELRRVGGQMQSLGANESFGDRYFKDDPSTSGLLTELRDGYLNLPPAYHNNPRIRQGYQLAMGAVARYGANPAQWPAVVRGRVGKEVAGVQGLDQFIGRIRGDLHVNG